LGGGGSDDQQWHQAGGKKPHSTDRQQKAGPPNGTGLLHFQHRRLPDANAAHHSDGSQPTLVAGFLPAMAVTNLVNY
jgi:hypothetical protein